jgi:hypothetical protein
MGKRAEQNKTGVEDTAGEDAEKALELKLYQKMRRDGFGVKIGQMAGYIQLIRGED